jgi:hypothetical protein
LPAGGREAASSAATNAGEPKLGLTRHVARYAADSETAAWLASGTQKPEFLEYDWALNQR